MSSHVDATLPPTRRPRKSLGQSPARKRMDKENITVDVASSLAGNASRKKSRSKSMGPGGLDALKPGTGNRRVSLAAPTRPPPRSILKPTIPILPEIPPHKPKARYGLKTPGTNSPFKLLGHDDPNSSGTKVALRTEEEQQAAARKREEEERAALEKEIKDRREARRKSLANRRVSFAAEATLHTFHEIEYMQDSTSSSNASRRASALAAQSSTPAPEQAPTSPEAPEPPSTPPEQGDFVSDTPEHQRDLHQKKHRRSSGASTLNYHNQDDDTLASTVYSSDSEAPDGVIETHEELDSDSGSDSDNDGTTMDLDVDEVTGTSIASGRSNWTERSSDSENDTLDSALRLAQRQAHTQSIDEEEEIIPSFGWAKKPAAVHHDTVRPEPDQPITARFTAPNEDEADGNDTEMDMDMEMTHAIGGILASNIPEDDAADEEMSMDVTKVLGGILSRGVANVNRQPTSQEDRDEQSFVEDATMEMTMALGGIRQPQPLHDDLIDLESNADDFEDMSMEMTTVLGGVLASKSASSQGRKSLPSRRRTVAAEDEATMDMTVGLGRIIPSNRVTEVESNEDDATMGMDMTTAIGGIIANPSPLKRRSLAKQLMEEEVDQNDSTPVATNSPAKKRLSALVGASNSPSSSPGLSAFRGKGLRHSMTQRQPSSSPVRHSSPAKSSSPFKELTPKSKAPLSSPLKTPTPRRSLSRSPVRTVSPQRPIMQDPAIPKSIQKSPKKASVFQQDPSTGVSTPKHVLTPQKRRLSGVGLDRPGLGSPKVAQIMDRRGSLSEAATEFVPSKLGRGVSFVDPRPIERELDLERRSEEEKESGRVILEREADGDDENSTTTLKDMISSMTPKKQSAPMRGRKSLHVGSAMGLLGKRPAELDEEEEDDERDGIKRLKGHQGSPVKNVRLNAPPSKAETIGRATRPLGHVLEETNGNINTPTMLPSPKKGTTTVTSPQAKGKFKDVEDQPTNTFSFDEPTRPVEPHIYDDDEEHIHLQDFLNMTSIRFMELTTTKRRHTQAPNALQDSTLHKEEDVSLERCVVAGACTVPMLELYQHSCRELKKYISEGRRIIRGIETDTFEENPPLFKEYISASPDFKILMDNQFKNVKTHARLLSKAMWYEWRMKLQDGIKEGLVKIAEGMDEDEQFLRQQEELAHSVLPELMARWEALEAEHENLQAIAHEIADCDPEDLQAARAELTELDSDMEAKIRQIEELRQSLKVAESAADDATRRKEICVTSIAEAEQVREECRGWTSNEINSLKAKVEVIEKEHGWNITGTSGSTVSMTYRREIELVFDIASFQSSENGSGGAAQSSNSRIDLWYIAANREIDAQPSTPEKEFFLQAIRDYVRRLDQGSTKISTLLRVVGAAWVEASAVADDIRLLTCTFPTKISRTGDSSLALKIPLLLAPLETKVELVLGLDVHHMSEGLRVAILPQAKVIYGEHFKVDNVCEYLTTRLGDKVVAKQGDAKRESWSDIIVELHERLLARGRR